MLPPVHDITYQGNKAGMLNLSDAFFVLSSLVLFMSAICGLEG